MKVVIEREVTTQGADGRWLHETITVEVSHQDFALDVTSNPRGTFSVLEYEARLAVLRAYPNIPNKVSELTYLNGVKETVKKLRKELTVVSPS